MPDETMFDFLAQIIRKEGGWIIEPAHEALHRDQYLRNLLSRLRLLPARIVAADPQRLYRFAERGEEGRWMFIWIPRN